MLLRPIADPHWESVASALDELVAPGDLILAPNEFLRWFPGTIALHVSKRMIWDETIAHFVLHKGMLDRVDPIHLREAAGLTPVFANEVFVVFSHRGERLPDAQLVHLEQFREFMDRLPARDERTGAEAVVVATYNRPAALNRTLAALIRQRRPIIVIDDGSDPDEARENARICDAFKVLYNRTPLNMGTAHTVNVGVCHWLAHPEIEWISVFNDDVDVADGIFETLRNVIANSPYPDRNTVYSGYESRYHAPLEHIEIGGRRALLLRSCSGQHIHAHIAYWQSVLPVPTAYRGAPKKSGGVFSGQGADEDWWIASWSPRSAPKRGGCVIVISGLVENFAKDAALSTWGNES